jgi:hypothetical protein
MQPCAEYMPQEVGTQLFFVNASQFQISSHYTTNVSMAEFLPIGRYKEPAILSPWTIGYIIYQ